MPWEFGMKCYYAKGVKKPKLAGALAIHTQHKDETSLYMDVLAAKNRKDVGTIHWWGPVSPYMRSLLGKTLAEDG